MKKLLLLTGVLVFLLFSCDGDGTLPPEDGDPIDEPGVVKGNFWAQSFIDESFYQLEAGLLAEGTYCNIWVEKGSGVSKDDAKKVADKYDKSIYPKMMAAFGIEAEFEEEGEVVANNTMEYADWWGDGDGKLTILLLDIKDGYNGTTNKAYTGGYFWSGNFFMNENLEPGMKSNVCDMIYVDANPGLKLAPENTYGTLAHEMQHMMSFVTGLLTRDEDLDTWVDEGLSSAAEWVYFGNHTSNGRVKSYKDNSSGLINKGNNFFVWDNHQDNDYAILDDYSTVYLFFQWLRLQAGSDVYKYIITSDQYDYYAVTASFSDVKKETYSWSKLLETWLAANRINAASGLYGYKNETELKNVKAPDAPNATSISLYPGEGVYSVTNADPNVTSSGNIKYAYLSAAAPSNTYGAGVTSLLTYNGNTNPGGSDETGKTTGVVSASVNVVSDGRNIQSDGLIRLDARDMLRRNGRAPLSAGVPRLSRRVVVNE